MPGTNFIKLASWVQPKDESLLISTPRIVYSDELRLLGFGQYFAIPSAEKVPVCWAVDRNYYYKGDLIASVKSASIFCPPVIRFDNSIHRRLFEIDVPKLLAINEEALFTLENESRDYIKQVFKKYTKKKKTFVASFSGGKDSQVVLDLVSKVIPPDKYHAVYMDTGMELPCTQNLVRQTEQMYKKQFAHFKMDIAASDQTAISQWERFGPPSRFSRWCCSVRKTAVFTKKMKDILHTDTQPQVLVFEGVRGEESVRRQSYSRTAEGVKHVNLTNARPIFLWNDTEVYLYFLRNRLPMNEGYYKGLTRIGCNICPFASPWSESLIGLLYPNFVAPYVEVIRRLAVNLGLEGKKKIDEYVSEGFWKKNAGGKGLDLDQTRFDILEKKPDFKCVIRNGKSDWKLWFGVLGEFEYQTKVNGSVVGTVRLPSGLKRFSIEYRDSKKVFTFFETGSSIYETSLLSKVMLKIAYCERCGVCEAECPTGALRIRSKEVSFDNRKCVHCHRCLQVHSIGCIVASRRRVSEGGNLMNSVSRTSGVDKYSTFGMREQWIKNFFDLFEDYFLDYGGLGPKQITAMINWLREAELLDQKDKKVSQLATELRPVFAENPLTVYEIIWINLCFNSAVVNNYVTKLNSLQGYTKEDLIANLQDSYPSIGVSTLANPVGALINTFENSPFGYSMEGGTSIDNLQMGVITGSGRKGNKKISIIGGAPISPYSMAYLLYKIAETSGVYEFVVSDFFKEGELNPKSVFNISKTEFLKDLRSAEELGFLKVDLVAGLENVHLNRDFSTSAIVSALRKRYE